MIDRNRARRLSLRLLYAATPHSAWKLIAQLSQSTPRFGANDGALFAQVLS
jgi:hypothetical protein